MTRQAEIKRKTKETDISVKLVIEGSGRARSRRELVFSTICSNSWRGIR